METSELSAVTSWTIYLKENEISDELVLADKIGGNIHFNAKIHYIEALNESKTVLDIQDEHHAVVSIGTQPMATTFSKPFAIGTYKREKLFLGTRVAPIRSDGKHEVVIVLYVSKS